MKARKMWAKPTWTNVVSEIPTGEWTLPVLVQALDAESVAELRVDIAQAIAESYGGDFYGDICQRATLAVMASIGITAKRPRAKKGKKP